MTLGARGSVTSTAVTFFGADSWASHRTRRPSRPSWMTMPSPQLPKPPRSSWARSRIFKDRSVSVMTTSLDADENEGRPVGRPSWLIRLFATLLLRRRRRQQAVDGFLEGGVRKGPHHPRSLELVPARVGQADEECRRAVGLELLRFRDVLANPCRRLSRIEALVEGRDVQAERLRVLGEIRAGQLPLIGEQPVVHLPVLALLSRTVCRLGRLHRERMNGLEGQITEHVLHLARLNVFLVQLG